MRCRATNTSTEQTSTPSRIPIGGPLSRLSTKFDTFSGKHLCTSKAKVLLYYQSQCEQTSIPSPIKPTGRLLSFRNLEKSSLIIEYRLMDMLNTRGGISRWESRGVNGSTELQHTIFVYLFIYFLLTHALGVQAQMAQRHWLMESYSRLNYSS